MSLVCKTRKATVETILKQLEYFTKRHIGTNANIIVLNLKWLYSLVPFSSLVATIANYCLNNIIMLITRSCLYAT